MARKRSPDLHAPVVVLATSRDDDLALAKSMLMSADIPFFTKNEMIVDLFGYARFGGANRITGPMELLVAPKDADDACEILKLLDSPDRTRAIKRDEVAEQAQTDKPEVVLFTSQKSELTSAQLRLQAADIPFTTTAKVIDHKTQAQLSVATSDVNAAREALSLSCEAPEADKDLSDPSSTSSDSSSTGDLSSGLWGFAPRTVRMVAVLILIGFAASWSIVPLLASLAPQPEYLSWNESARLSTSDNVQGMTISGSGSSIPAAYQKIEDRFMNMDSISAGDMADMLSELSTASGVYDVTVTLPGSSDSLSIQEAIAKLSKMPPSRSIQLGALSWTSDQ
ncbi:MAG: DUF2007 domain-containing protein [Coriobacteriia bacterium]|nr:DUF2007 domain-containing protein [Coriobacteriia bacterium]